MLGMRGTREVLQQAAPPRSPIQDAMKQAGSIRMGVRQLPELPSRAPKPEWPVPEGSPAIRRLQKLRQEIGPMQGPREATSADYIFQPAIRGMRNPAGMRAPGTMFSREFIEKGTGNVTEPGAKIGGRMMSGEYPNSPMRTVVRETEMQVSPGQGELPLDFRSNKELLAGTQPMVAPVVGDSMRPMGVQIMDLSQIDPRITGAVGAGSLVVGLDQIFRDAENKRVADLAQDMPAETKASKSSDLPTPQEASRINELISSVVADASQQGGIYGELVSQNAPRDPSSYPSVLAYQAAQMQFIEDLASGAFNQAAAVYEQQQREAAAPQSGQNGESITTETFTSELGSDDMANAVGAGQAKAEAMMTPPPATGPIDTSTKAQGASDLATAATPRPKPETRMASTALMQSLQDQIAARIAQDSEAAMRAGMSPMAQRIRFEGDIRDRDIEARASFDPRFDRR